MSYGRREARAAVADRETLLIFGAHNSRAEQEGEHKTLVQVVHSPRHTKYGGLGNTEVND